MALAENRNSAGAVFVQTAFFLFCKVKTKEPQVYWCPDFEKTFRIRLYQEECAKILSQTMESVIYFDQYSEGKVR